MSNFSQKVSLGACSLGWPSQRCSLPASACKASPNAAPRDSLFIFMHVRTSRGHPTRVCRGRVTFLEDFGAAAPFFSIKQIPRLRRTLAGDSRTGRFRRRGVNCRKDKNGAAGYQHLERGANDMVSNICSLNSFSTERVLLLSAENASRA